MNNEDVKERISNEVIKDFVWRRRWRLVTWIGVSIFALLAVVKYFWAYGLPTFGNQIAVIDINGEIGQGYIASADKVVPVLRNAFQNEDVTITACLQFVAIFLVLISRAVSCSFVAIPFEIVYDFLCDFGRVVGFIGTSFAIQPAFFEFVLDGCFKRTLQVIFE